MQLFMRQPMLCGLASILLSGILANVADAADWRPEIDKARITFRTTGAVKVEGLFSRFETVVKGDLQTPESLETQAVIQADSVATGSDWQDNVLKGDGFFNVRRFPLVAFKTTRIERIDAGHARVRGDLTMIGITRPIEFRMNVGTPVFDPAVNGIRVHTQADIVINRKDWGMAGYALMVDKNILVHVDLPLISNGSRVLADAS